MSAAASAGTAEAPLTSWSYAWRLHRFRPKRQLINLAGVLLGWSGDLVLGVAAKVVFDHISNMRQGAGLGWLWWPMALLTGRALVGVMTAFTLQATNGRFAFANAAMLQRNLLRRILQLPGGRALPGSPGEAISRFRDDTEAVVWYPIQLNNVIGSTVSASLAVVVMASINVTMTVGVVVPLVLVFAVVEAARTRIVAYRLANMVTTAEVTGFVGDVFASSQSILAAHAQDRVVARFRVLNADRRRAAVRDRVLTEILRSTFWVVNLGTGAVLILAGRALRSGGFTVGDLALFVTYLGVFQRFVRDAGEGLTGYRQLGVSFGRMNRLLAGAPAQTLVATDDIFERGPLPAIVQPSRKLEPFVALRADDLTYRHGERGGGIHGVSLTLEAGSFTVVTGRVGAGKTTLLQCLLGLVPAEGTIVWNGAEVVDPATFLVPPRIAYTPQVPQLFSDSLAGNILLGADGDLDEALRLAVLEEDVAEMADGLATRIGSRGVRLSGGQVQRTAAARMFARRPQLLVCDDLSSALDVETEAAVWDGALADRTRTVLAVSHRRAALQRADRVIVMSAGRVVDTGTLADLLERCEEMRLLWRAEPEPVQARPEDASRDRGRRDTVW